MASNQAWVTLATNDSYALGALVLAHSLKRSGTIHNIVVMITSSGISPAMRAQLESVFDEVVDVSALDSGDSKSLELLERPDLGITFTKLHCWKLVQYSKCVFLDADTLVVRNSDELFQRDQLSAAPDAGWPDCFNSGVFVFTPCLDTFVALMRHAEAEGSFDGGDQGLLNTFFADWATQDISKHLPFLYNMCATATYTYLPAYKRFGHQVKIVHFIGASKPWHVKFDSDGQPLAGPLEKHALEHLKQWWHVFHSDVKPKMCEVGGCWQVAGCEEGFLAFSGSCPPAADAAAPAAVVKQDDRQDWERGQPDYCGSASFDNILKKIDSTLSSPKSDS